MRLDAIRFCVGPWKGRYSSLWRVWSNPGDDNVYLGVSALLKYMKISLHRSGKFRVGFVDHYNEHLIAQGKDPVKDRAFLKWDKRAVRENDIMQALDIYFPLRALSEEKAPSPRKRGSQFILVPHEESLGEGDSVVTKLVFHRLHPDSDKFHAALRQRGFIPGFYCELSNGEFLSVVYGYAKRLPIDLKKERAQQIGHLLADYFLKSEKSIGDTINGLTLQLYEMGTPPSMYELGGVSVTMTDKDKFSIGVGQPLGA